MSGEKSTVKNWIIEILRKFQYDRVEVDIAGSTEKGEGYIGDIVFAKVNYSKQGNNGQLDVVLKHGKFSQKLRDKLPVDLAFEREILVYGTIVPLFQQLEANYKLDLLNFLPKTYGSILREKEEVLLMQNLKSLGYELHDRFQPLDINHLKLTLESYGRFHAFGMAYRHKNQIEFKEKFCNITCIMKIWMKEFVDFFVVEEKIIQSILEKRGEPDLAQRLNAKFPNGFLKKYLEMLDVEEPNCAFIHGDCWNNNYMFKYTDTEQTRPEEVVFLDFQMVKVAPPLFDVAHHIYATSSEVELENFESLLRTYHQSLTKCLKDLGCNPEELFPYSELLRQWNAYSAYGFVIGTAVMSFALSDKDDAMDIQEVSGDNIRIMFDRLKKGKHYDQLESRLFAVTKHFLNNSNLSIVN